jgi:tetratricopeptide (TPR) repeat protein
MLVVFKSIQTSIRMLELRPNRKTTAVEKADQEDLRQRNVLFFHPNLLRFFICLFLILITFAAFWQVRNNEFINLDDDLYVTDNVYVSKGLTFHSIFWALTSVYRGHWHPITWLSHMFDYDLYGLNSSGHHLTNLIFHIANALLLFILFHRMTSAPWRSGFLAALFALHPLHVESVAWVAERKDVLSAFFWMLAIWAYVYYVEKPKLNRYLFVVLCFLLALMSKPVAVTLPFALLLLDFWPLRRLRLGIIDNGLNPSISKFMNAVHRRVVFSRLVLEKIPLFLLAAVLSLVTVLAHRGSGAVSSIGGVSLEARIGNALVSYVKYIEKMIWPDRLAVLYPHPIILPLWKVAGAVLMLAMISVLVILAGRKRPYYIMGWLWYLGTLLPTIGLVQAGVQGMADRFTYIPMIGLFIMVVYGISDIVREWRCSKVVLTISGAVWLLILMVSTVNQVQLWRNSVTLFNHTLKVTVNNSLIENNLGVTLARQGKDYDAAVHYKKALEINPRYSDAHYNLAALLVRQGKDQEAMVHFVEALRAKPNSAEAHNDLGVFLTKHGKIQEAIFHFLEAIRINPNYGGAYFNLGLVLLEQRRNEEAISSFNEALRINPEKAEIQHHLGAALAGAGKTAEAAVHYNVALKMNPQNALGHYELGVILARQGKDEEAIVHLAEALRIIPDYGEAHLALGMIYLEMGKRDLAFERYKILQAINKDLAEGLYKKICGYKNRNR